MKFVESKLAHKYLSGLEGIEIGASAHNPFGLNTKNIDYTKEMDVFKQGQIELCGECAEVDIVSPGDDLPFKNEEVDFVISSHAVEHFFDPIKTIKEWLRVSKKYVFIIAPHKERTFDEDRKITSPEELRLRYEGKLSSKQVNSPENEYFNGETGPYGHWNVWDTEAFLSLCEQEDWNVVEVQDSDDKVGNGFTVVLSKEREKEKRRDLRADLSPPYYIFSPSYTDSSAGVIALHKLCHSLNISGQEAYITSDLFSLDGEVLSLDSEENPEHRIKVNKFLRTPVLTSSIINKHKVLNQHPIVIYPETVTGNPLRAEIVARYILYFPGKLAGDTHYAEDEILFVYREQFLPDDMEAKTLCLPTSDLILFNTEHVVEDKREGRYVFASRYVENGGELLDITADAELLSFKNKKTLKELSEIFKKAELLYSYEASALCIEAMLCGCPVIFIPNEQMDSIPIFDLFGDNGAAWGATEKQIQHAKDTVKNVHSIYLELERRFWPQLDTFIYDTQLKAKLKKTSEINVSDAEKESSLLGYKLFNPEVLRLKIAILTVDLVGHACLSIRLENVLNRLNRECEYRYLSKELTKEGEKETFFDEELLQWADLVIIQRSAAQAKNAEFIEKIFTSNCKVIYETDDLLTEPLPTTNILYHSFKAHIPFIREVVRKADLVTVSTPYLHQHMRGLNSNIRILPNLIDNNIWKTVKPNKNKDKLKILYAGTLTHVADLEMIENVLLQLHEKYPDKIELVLAGCSTDRLKGISTLLIEQSVAYEEYAQIVQDVQADIAIAPLIDAEFNHSKSNIKWLEYSISGCAGVYSDVDAYSMLIDGVTGLLVKTDEEWFVAIERLILNEDERYKIASNAQDLVSRDYTLKRGSQVYLDTWKNMGSDFSLPRERLVLPQKQEEGYQEWSQRRRLMPSQTQFMAERMLAWQHQPTYHIIMLVNDYEMEFLSDTLASLESQLYSGWGLTLISRQARPVAFESVPENIEWIHLDEQVSIQAAIMAAIMESETDWVIQMAPGDIFDFHTLLKVSDTVNEHLDYAFIYCDEDLDDDGLRYRPLLKPDFNLYLLRSSSYIGRACFVRRKELIELGGYIDLAYVHNTDMCLKVFEQYGGKAIGHIDDVIYHGKYHQVNERLQKENELTVRYDHLSRCGQSGFVRARTNGIDFDIQYFHEKQPKVSIILANNDRHINSLANALERIVEFTDYDNIEIIVVHTTEGNEDYLNFYDDIKLRLKEKLTVLSSPKSSYSALINYASAAARGDYICIFSIYSAPAHAAWLSEIMKLAQVDNVGMVGPKVIDSLDKTVYAGGVLGLTNDVKGLYYGESLSQPGYMKRANLTQNYSALSSAAFVIKKSVFSAVGMLDESIFADTHYCVLDLCLRVKQANYSVVWNCRSIIRQDVEKAECNNGVNVYKLEVGVQKELFKVWGSEFRKDEFYNRHLTLSDFNSGLDIRVVPEWDGVHKSKLQVLAFPFNHSGNGEYRVRSPLRVLADNALIEKTLLANHESVDEYYTPNLFEIHRANPDVIFIQNGFNDQIYSFLQMIKAETNLFVVFGVDDLVDQLAEKNSRKQHVFRDMKYRLRRTFDLCDRVIASTRFLAEAYASYHDDIVVIPNRIELLRWQGIKNVTFNKNKKPRVGWAGAQQHYGDLEILFSVVKKTAKEIDWVFFGMCPEELQPYIKEEHEFVIFDRYPEKLAGLNLDLAVAPLELNDFNKAKSNLRLLEYGLMAWPVICTDIEPYKTKNPPVIRVNNEHDEWLEAIQTVLSLPDKGKGRGETLKKWVLNHYTLDDKVSDWKRALTPRQ